MASNRLFRAAAIIALSSLSACRENDKDAAARGSPGSAAEAGRSAAHEPAGSDAAPDAQPQYGQVGTKTSSHVVTNVAGKPQGDTTQGSRDADAALSERVRVALSTGTTGTTGIYAPDTLLDISVTASNGIVTLRGAVGSQSARQSMEERARAMDGVKGVINQLEVSAAQRGRQPGAPAGRGQVDIVPQQGVPNPQ